MTKHCLFLLTLLQVLVTSQAAICEGDTFNSCNGLANTCTDDGLCVIDTSTGVCCLLSKPYGWNNCMSDEDGDICDGQLSGEVVAVDDATTPSPTLKPNPSPTPSPTPGPTPRPTNTNPPTPKPTEEPTMSNPPTETCYNIEIGLIFDEWPAETRWEITQGRRNSIENENAEVIKKSPFYDPDNGYKEASETHIVCLPKGKYTYTIMDRNKDGMCCDSGEGRYAVTYQESGEVILYGSEFEQFESVTFQIPYVTPQLRDADGDGIEDRTKNVIPPMILTEDGFPPAVCANEFGLHLETDDYGVETTWELRERSATRKYEDGKVVVSGGPYTSDFTYELSYCLHPGQYTFVFYDWQCDGLTGNKLTGSYTLKVNGDEKYTGGTTMKKYWEEVELDFVEADIGGTVMAAVSTSSSGERMISGWLLGMAVMISAVLVWN